MYSINAGGHAHSSTMLLAQPIPQEVSCHIADHIQVIFSGFPEQSKTSVLHMSSLFHAFILCQVYTLGLELYTFSRSRWTGFTSDETDRFTFSLSALDDVLGRIVEEQRVEQRESQRHHEYSNGVLGQDNAVRSATCLLFESCKSDLREKLNCTNPRVCLFISNTRWTHSKWSSNIQECERITWVSVVRDA